MDSRPEQSYAVSVLQTPEQVAEALLSGLVGDVRLLHNEVLQLRRVLATRAAIEQARGILMCRYRIDAKHAFSLLERLASVTNTELRAIAMTLIDSAATAAESGGSNVAGAGAVMPVVGGRSGVQPVEESASREQVTTARLVVTAELAALARCEREAAALDLCDAEQALCGSVPQVDLATELYASADRHRHAAERLEVGDARMLPPVVVTPA